MKSSHRRRTPHHPHPVGDLVRPPTVLASESTTEESEGHRNPETGRGQPTGRPNPGIGNRPLDKRVSRTMAGRQSRTLEMPKLVGRELELVQIPNIGSNREGSLHHLSFRDQKKNTELDRLCNPARVPPQSRTGRTNPSLGCAQSHSAKSNQIRVVAVRRAWSPFDVGVLTTCGEYQC
jgi:hypothetical protein